MIVDVLLPADVPLLRLILAAVAAAVMSVGAWHARSLAASGMVAAIALGTAIVGAAGWWAGLLLIAFFVTSSALSQAGPSHSSITTSRGSRRDAVQVAANGSVAALCALGSLVGAPSLWLLAMAGSLAAANADTWSTELGRRNAGPPRLITSWRRVPPGTSGAVSGLGTAGAALGGIMIAALASVGAAQGWLVIDDDALRVFLAISIAGLGGSLLDSLLGATVQEQRWCPNCSETTERLLHHCDTRTTHLRGIGWVTNDIVNLGCVASGALLAVGIFLLIH